jgi:RNA polymerase sigma-70 factor (ECF subfamily)
MTEFVTEPAASEESKETPSFDAVFQSELGYVWSTLRRLGVREADAQDQAQEVFVVVHQILGDYDPSRPLRPWLFGIAYRVACRYRALARHRREVGAPDDAPEPVDPGPGADAALEASQARDLVLRALDGIELGRRAVFVMNVIDERPMPEVAEALQIPLNTAYSRLRLAREDFEQAVKRLRAARGPR